MRRSSSIQGSRHDCSLKESPVRCSVRSSRTLAAPSASSHFGKNLAEMAAKRRIAPGALMKADDALRPARETPPGPCARRCLNPPAGQPRTCLPGESVEGSPGSLRKALLEVADTSLEDRLVEIAGDVLVQAAAGAFRVAHLAEHATVRAGDPLDGEHRAVRVHV